MSEEDHTPKVEGVRLEELASSRRARSRFLSGTLVLGAVVAVIIGLFVTCGEDKRPELVIVVPPTMTEPRVTPPLPDSGPMPDGGLSEDLDAGIELPQVTRPPTWRVSSYATDPAYELVSATVGKFPLSIALQKAGIGKGEVARVVASLRVVKNVDRSRPEDRFSIATTRDRAKRVVAFEYSSSAFDVWQAREDSQGALVSRKLELARTEVPIRVFLSVSGELKAALDKAGLDESMEKEIERALDGHLRLSEIVPGTRVGIVGTEEQLDGQFYRYAPLDAVDIRAGAHVLRVYRYSSSRIVGSFDRHGKQPLVGGWRSPIPFARISSRFNPRRMHPVLHVVMPHNGVDFAATTGTPIFGVAPGVVKFSGDSGACGNMVQILHANGLVSAYCHLQRISPKASVGKQIGERDVIGYVGQTGRVTGPHLHFAVKRGDTFIDPMALRLDRIKVIPAAEHGEFAQRKEALDRELNALEPLPVEDAGVDPSDNDAGDEILDDDLTHDGGSAPAP